MAKSLCCICEIEIKSGDWYCYKCFKQFNDDIIANKPWTRFLQNYEKRRRRKREPYFIYLGNKYDITENGRLVIRDGYGRQKT